MLYFHKLQNVSPTVPKKAFMANPPANISTTAKLMTRYVLRLRRLRFFIKTITVMRFSVTIATDNINPTASQVMHSGNENIRKTTGQVFSLCVLLLRETAVCLLREIEVTSWLVSADDFSSRVARGANERVSAANE